MCVETTNRISKLMEERAEARGGEGQWSTREGFSRDIGHGYPPDRERKLVEDFSGGDGSERVRLRVAQIRHHHNHRMLLSQT